MNVYNPVSTYRIQFHKDFRFSDAEKILNYLHSLGITAIYASPILKAETGSTHGYDVTDPLKLNPEIGDEESFKSLINAIHKKKMGWIQDFVPNHMAYSTENPWIYDLLRKGKNSIYFHFFDIFTNHPEEGLRERIMLPFFGKAIEELINDGELTLLFEKGGFKLQYFDNVYPVSDQAYPVIFKSSTQKDFPEYINKILKKPEPLELNDEELENLHTAFMEENDMGAFISNCINEINTNPDKKKLVLKNLAYIPAFWRETEEKINFRRFFTINGLISLNIQNEEVFRSYHNYLFSMVKSGFINGLRIDHIDGLSDPSAYLEKLRESLGEGHYIVVEKILEEDEKLPVKWPVQGSTGYEFLAMVNNLLTNEKNGKDLYNYYSNWTEESDDSYYLMHKKKRFILHNRLKGELDILSYECNKLASPTIKDIDFKNLKDAIAEFMVYCPVYKIYNVPSSFTKDDKKLISEIFNRAIKRNEHNKEALEGLKATFLLSETTDNATIKNTDVFFRRCMQFTGPLMAKGIEDTAFYSYNPFIVYNEVGDNPTYFGISTGKFHSLMEERQKNYPLSMNTVATHDTKRGDDARARINVLSDIPRKWRKITKYWKEINYIHKEKSGIQEAPTSNDEYFIYQTLCAHLPMDGKFNEDFVSRLKDYLVKAFREAKVNSSWSEPDTDYEEKTLKFIDRILDSENEFHESYISFVKEIIPHGINNALTQTILKNTAPGVPDTFQGTEIWNLSFVDPDNRRPVDYQNLSGSLDMLKKDYSENPASTIERLWQNSTNGFIKQWITYITLQERINNPELFYKGSYVPVQVKGKYSRHIISFMRKYRDNYFLVVLPLNTSGIEDLNEWGTTRIKLPEISPPLWKNIISQEELKADRELLINDIFGEIPFGLLRGIIPEPRRKAGILMHISSLPGEYGIGDFGPEASNFIDFLSRSGQHYWQILPLSQSDKLTAYSPYSSYSAFAGNILFTHPYQLVKTGLLDARELEKFKKEESDKVDYPGAEEAKHYFLDKAFEAYKKLENERLSNEIRAFREKEKYWLEDFALFLALKHHFNLLPWNEWPEEFRDRDERTLEIFKNEHHEEIEKIIFKQYIFSDQWSKIRTEANDKGIEIFGDIPIYIDYDSADVWAHPHLFRLRENKTMEAVAGVPPDYFNENGQLWGMPLFNWKEMKKNGYEWWLNRIGRNLEWFDLLRLDHFRGFSAYWEVPAGSETAINGRWIEGPGNELFDAISGKFPGMPLVAEDLGQIDQPVYDLRDDYKLPGMRVMQFGFEENMPWLQHTPVNYNYNSIAYTGTHDNNTMKGWFRKEASNSNLKRFKKYTGKKLKEKNCHIEMIRLTYASRAKIAIVPMQDWLGLDENSRMNFPSTTEGNWLWKLRKGQLKRKVEKKIRKMSRTFGRI